MFIMKNDNTIFIPIPNYPKRRFIYARGEVGRAMKTEALVKERKKAELNVIGTFRNLVLLSWYIFFTEI